MVLCSRQNALIQYCSYFWSYFRSPGCILAKRYWTVNKYLPYRVISTFCKAIKDQSESSLWRIGISAFRNSRGLNYFIRTCSSLSKRKESHLTLLFFFLFRYFILLIFFFFCWHFLSSKRLSAHFCVKLGYQESFLFCSLVSS